jgi:hypothetical protein
MDAMISFDPMTFSDFAFCMIPMVLLVAFCQFKKGGAK